MNAYDDKNRYTPYGSLKSKRDNSEINAHNADVNMIVGRRSNGKTYPTVTFDGVKHFLDSGCTEAFAYVRRFDSDFRIGQLATLLFTNGCVMNGWLEWYSKGQWNDIYYYRGAWYLRFLNSEGKVQRKCNQPMCYAFSINQCEKYKGADHPDIVTIILDEFIPMKSERGYIAGEWELWQNIVSSIVRERGTVKIYMLANTISKNCPYFDHYHLDIDDMEQGTISVFNFKGGLKLAVEYCKDSGDVHIESSKYFDIDDEEDNMITKGTWETENYPKLTKDNPFRRYKDFICFQPIFIKQGKKYLRGEFLNTGEKLMLYIHKISKAPERWEDVLYVESFTEAPIHKHNCRIGFNPRQYQLDNTILKMYENNQVWYQDNDTGEKFKYYLNNTT